ncbi:MAG TPA: TonB-dependent receptor [Vicinamibacterales bacterium]|nr:TonB-dependent receptor [Vicinamibacterales bacterium]
MRRILMLPTALAAVLLMAIVTPRAYGEEQQEKKVDSNEEVSLEDLLKARISVSSTTGETILESSSVVTVVDRKTIEQHGYRTVEEALQSVAGITVMRSYLLQGMVTSRGVLQDLYANKNLVLIDGVPSWHAVTGESRIERVGINDVERIEVLKGPASVLYGSQAYTSAINIVTRSAKRGTQSADGTIGSRGASASFRMASMSGLEFAIGANRDLGQHVNYNFYDENGTMGNVNDYQNATDTTMQVKYRGHSVLFNAYDEKANTFGSAPAYKTGANTPQYLNGILGSYQYDQKFGTKLNFLGRAFYDSEYREFSRDNTNTVYAPIDGYRDGATVRANYAATKEVSIEVGSDYEYRVARQATSRNRQTDALLDGFTNQNMTESSVFTQVGWKPGHWQLVGGTRYTNNSLFGGNVSSRGTVGYKLTEHDAVKFIVGQSYRSPSLWEIYTASPNISGNPALKPETSDSIELVYQHAQGGLYTQIGGYWAKYDQKIFRQKGTPPANAPNPNAPVFYVNGAPFNGTGIEGELKYTTERWGAFFANVDLMSGTSGDLVVEQPTGYMNYNYRYVPAYTLKAGATRQWGPVGASTSVDHTGQTQGAFGPVDPWTDVQANVWFEHPAKGVTLRHTFSGRNLLNSDIAFPEYSRRKANVNELPYGADPGFFYTLGIRF